MAMTLFDAINASDYVTAVASAHNIGCEEVIVAADPGNGYVVSFYDSFGQRGEDERYATLDEVESAHLEYSDQWFPMRDEGKWGDAD